MMLVLEHYLFIINNYIFNQLILGLAIVYNFCNYLTDNIIAIQNTVL